MATKKDLQPFVVIMQHDAGSDPYVAVRATWEEAVARAAKFWKSYDGVFDPTVKDLRRAFKAGEGYDQVDVAVTMRRGNYLCVTFDDGPRVTVERAERVKTAKG